MRKLLPLLLFLMLFLVEISGAQITEEQKSSVMISDYQVSPEVLMCNDIGTVTVTVKNMESVKSVNIKEARMLSSDIDVLSDSYFNIGRLGPGESMDITFTIKATCPDGIHYPRILVEGEDAQNIRYSMPVQVDSTPLTLAVKGIPKDIFEGEPVKLELVAGNPRPNTATGLKITTDDNEVIPSEVFVGALPPDESKTACFNFTPSQKGAHRLNFGLVFKNGDNCHSVTLSTILDVTENKKRAELHLTDIEIQPSDGASNVHKYKITGEVSNTGLEEAKGVVVKVGEAEGVAPALPNPVCPIGSIPEDDFDMFELDVAVDKDVDVTEIPLLIEYKDKDGDLFSKTEYIPVEHPQETASSSSGEMPVPMIIALVVVAAFVIGAIVYSWKKR
jgi:hypothetical protein